MTPDEILVEIKLSYQDALKGIGELKIANEGLSKQIEEQRRLFKALKDDTEQDRESKARAGEELAKLEGQYKRNSDVLRTMQKVVVDNLKYDQEAADSYNKLSAELSLLTEQYNRMGEAEREGAVGQGIQQQMTETLAKMKELKEAYGDHRLDVGNYKKATAELRDELSVLTGQMVKLTKENKQSTPEFAAVAKEAQKLKGIMDSVTKTVNDTEEKSKNLKKQLRDVTQEMQQMAAAGERNTDKYKELSKQAGELKKEIGLVNAEIAAQANSTLAINAVSQGMSGLVGVFGLYQSVIGIAGEDNEKMVETMKNLQIVIAALSSITAIQNALQQKSNLMMGIARIQSLAAAAAIKMETKAKQGNIVTTAAATVAQAIFNAVANANPYVLLAVALISVIGALLAFASSSDSAADKQKKLNEAAEWQNVLIERRLKFLRELEEKEIKGYDEEIRMMKARGEKQEEIDKKTLQALQRKEDYAQEAYRQDINNIRALEQNKYLLTELENKLHFQTKMKKDLKAATEKQIELLKEEIARAEELSGAYRDAQAARAEEEARQATAKKAADKKAAEEYKKMRIDAEKKIQDITIKLMQDAKQRELAQAEANYKKDLEAFKGTAKQKTEFQKLLKQQYDNEVKKIEEAHSKEAMERAVEIKQQEIELLLAAVKEGSQEELNITLDRLKLEKQLELDAAKELFTDRATGKVTNEEALQNHLYLIGEKYKKLEKDTRVEYEKTANEELLEKRRIYWETQIANETLAGQDTLNLKLQQKEEELRMLTQMEEESEQAFILRQQQMKVEVKEIQDEIETKHRETSEAIMGAYGQMFGGMSNLLNQWAEDNEAMGAFAKLLAMVEVGLNTAKALSAGIAAAQSVPYPGNLVAIATTITSVLAAIGQATSILKKQTPPKAPKFSKGGFVSGFGSGTSDSVPSFLSNGESVMTAAATSMFAPLLSQLNMVGGGVPIQTIDTAKQAFGEEMLTRAFARAVAMLPAPMVAVTDINDGQSKMVGITDNFVVA